jgi:hypothetical protein
VNRPRYGNLIVLLDKGPIHLSIGPNCTSNVYVDGCFLSGFSFFCLLAILLCYTVTASYSNEIVILVAYGLSITQVSSYLFVALSNPSISLRENNPIKEVTSANSYRVCTRCGAEIKLKTYHCRSCDVCINGYDHHCQWVSKCIGKGNLYRFYFFVSFTPIYIFIFIGLMMSCLVISAEKMNSNLKHNS